MLKLFRDEVLEARKSQYLGSIRIGKNPSFTIVTIVALLLATALVSYAIWGQVTRKSKLSGILVPMEGTLNLSASQAGTLIDVRVKEGDAVRAGQVLMVVGTDRATAKGEASLLIAQSMEQRRASLQSERGLDELQFRQRQQSTADRIRSLETEQRQAEGELETVHRRLDLAKKTVERYGELAKTGFVADITFQQKQEDLLDLMTRQTTAERSLISIRRDSQALRAEQVANGSALEGQLAVIDRSLASLTQEGTENNARRELVITAPQSGTVTALIANNGQTVQVGQTLATVVPNASDGHPSRLEAQLFAPSRTAGFVQTGQSVWLRYGAYSYQKFGMAKGVVESISKTPINAQDLPTGQMQALQTASQSQEPMYRVTVSLQNQTISTYGQTQSLRAGMSLEADVIQERRRVWEWMLEPVLASSGLSTAIAGTAH